MRSLGSLRSLAGEPVLGPLGIARAAFGLVFLLRTTPILAALGPAFLRGGGWLGWPDSGWHVASLALPPLVVGVLVIARTAAAAAIMLGFYTRIAGLVAGIAGYLVLAQDVFGYFHHLHLLYLGAILFSLVDADAAWAVRRTPPRSPGSSLGLMRAFTASIYAWAAIGKLASEWGTGRALGLFRASGMIDRRIADTLLATTTSCQLVEISIVIGELALAVLLMLPRTRRLGLIAAIAMHIALEIVAHVDSIGWQMVALLLVFTRSAQPRPATQ